MWLLEKLRGRESDPRPTNSGQVAAEKSVEGAGNPDHRPHIQLTDSASDAGFIAESLLSYNLRQAGPSNYRALTVSARDNAGQLIGGIAGCTYWGWLVIGFFWIHEPWRGRGVGAGLLKVAEDEAMARGCHSSQLETFSFQNWGFYEANGYERYATLEDFPFEHRRIYFRKRLGSAMNSKRTPQ